MDPKAANFGFRHKESMACMQSARMGPFRVEIVLYPTYNACTPQQMSANCPSEGSLNNPIVEAKGVIFPLSLLQRKV